jgi:Protein of unknown function (DUF2608)
MRIVLLLYIIFHVISISAMEEHNIPVRTIYSLNESEDILQALDSNVLVIFDVDETLIISQDKVRRKHPEIIIAALKQDHFENQVLDGQQRDHLDSIMLNMAEQQLIEPQSPDLIKHLQSRGIRVIALTHMHTGEYFTIPNMEEWRYNQLYRLGIDMSVHNPVNITLNNLPRGRTSHPVFHKGILATSRSCQKGEALTELIAELLSKLGYKPSCVVIYDDLIEHLNSVGEQMKILQIPCIAFHYQATSIMDPTINVDIAAYQYAHLVAHQQWLSDRQVRALLQNNDDNNIEDKINESNNSNLTMFIKNCIALLLQLYRSKL